MAVPPPANSSHKSIVSRYTNQGIVVRSTRTGLERTVAISKEAQRALMEAHLNGEHAGYIPSYHKSMYETHPDLFNDELPLEKRLKALRKGVKADLVDWMITVHEHEKKIFKQTRKASREKRRALEEMNRIMGEIIQTVQEAGGLPPGHPLHIDRRALGFAGIIGAIASIVVIIGFVLNLITFFQEQFGHMLDAAQDDAAKKGNGKKEKDT